MTKRYLATASCTLLTTALLAGCGASVVVDGDPGAQETSTPSGIPETVATAPDACGMKGLLLQVDATMQEVAGAPPAPTGGTIERGSYTLQRVELFTGQGGASGPLVASLPGDTLVIADSPWGLMMLLTEPSTRTDLYPIGLWEFEKDGLQWAGGYFDAPKPGDTAFVWSTCGLGEQSVVDYSASGDTLILDLHYGTPSLPDETPSRGIFVRQNLD